GELVPYEPLGLELVGADERRAGARAEAQRLALRVEHSGDVQLAQVRDQLAVDPGVDSAGQAASEHTDLGALGQVEELVDEQLQLRRRDLRSALVDLGLVAGGRIDHRGRGARLLADAHEVVEDSLLGQVLDDARPGRPAGHTRGDHRLAECLQRARDVDALSARHRRLLNSAMAPAQPEAWDRERLVDRRVERDGDDHLTRLGLPSSLTTRSRTRSTTSAAIT